MAITNYKKKQNHMRYDKKIEAKNPGYAALLRCNDALNQLLGDIKQDEKVIGWNKVIRSSVVRAGLDILQNTIFEEIKYIEAEDKKTRKQK